MKAKFKAGDKVRILDGSIIENYAERWIDAGMKKHVGKVVTIRRAVPYSDDRIGYWMKEINFIWDERGLEPEKESKNETIVIYRKDREVIALDKRTGKKAVAKCNPEDEFDFKVGAEQAFERLMAEPPKFKIGDFVVANEKANEYYSVTWEGWRGVVVETDLPEFIKVKGSMRDIKYTVRAECFDLSEAGYSGKVVCTDVCAACSESFTIGKIYTIKNGVFKDDRGMRRPYLKDEYIKSVSDKLLSRYGSFIELVE